MKTLYVIKCWNKTYWEYYMEWDGRPAWSSSPYESKKFNSVKEAKNFLDFKIKNTYWGGIFNIEPIIISR